MINSKTATFIGFAIRSGKYRAGMNSIETLKKVRLLLVCNTASENSKEQAKKLSKKFNCPAYVSILSPLTEYTHTQNTKIMAITDASLSKAIEQNCAEEFRIL